jgi:hypothetical protein
MVLGELRRWGRHDAAADRLLPHADRALDWIERYGDADGDGFIEYARKTGQGLAHQGWEDSPDGPASGVEGLHVAGVGSQHVIPADLAGGGQLGPDGAGDGQDAEPLDAFGPGHRVAR